MLLLLILLICFVVDAYKQALLYARYPTIINTRYSYFMLIYIPGSIAAVRCYTTPVSVFTLY